MDISATELCLMLEEVLAQGDVDAVIITCPATNLSSKGFKHIQKVKMVGDVRFSCRVKLVIVCGPYASNIAHQEGNL